MLHMIGSTSLSAFADAIGRTGPATAVRAPAPAPARAGTAEATAAPQRLLEAVPPQPGRPLPRGSLLDLRV